MSDAARSLSSSGVVQLWSRNMAIQVERRLFTVYDYGRMALAGILTEDDLVELIEGEIVQMPPIGSVHAAAVNRLTSILRRLSAAEAILSVQNPVRLSV